MDSNNDNNLENYFFNLVLKKNIILHAIKEIHEILSKENDDIEDILELEQNSATSNNNTFHIDFLDLGNSLKSNIAILPKIKKLFVGKYEELEGLYIDDNLVLSDFLFGNDYILGTSIEEYINKNILNNIGEFRAKQIQSQGIVFYIIFSIIENLLNVDDFDLMLFLQHESKEEIELELLYTIEKALKLFEKNARRILLSYKSIIEKLTLSEDFLSDGEIAKFEEEVTNLAKFLVTKFSQNENVKENIKQFNNLKSILKK